MLLQMLRITVLSVSIVSVISQEPPGLLGYMCKVQPDFVACRPINEAPAPAASEPPNWKLARDQSSDNQQSIRSRSERTNQSLIELKSAMQNGNVELRTEKRASNTTGDGNSTGGQPEPSEQWEEAPGSNHGEVVIRSKNHRASTVSHGGISIVPPTLPSTRLETATNIAIFISQAPGIQPGPPGYEAKAVEQINVDLTEKKLPKAPPTDIRR